MVECYRSRLHESPIFSYYSRCDLFTHESLIEYLHHITIELDHIECARMMGEDVLREGSISWSDFDDMMPSDLYRPGDITQSLFIDKEVLSEGFFGSYFLHGDIVEKYHISQNLVYIFYTSLLSSSLLICTLTLDSVFFMRNLLTFNISFI